MKSTAVDESLSNTSTDVLFQRIPTNYKIVNAITNPFLSIESPSFYIIPTVHIFPEKEVNRMLLVVVDLGNDEV